MTAVPEAQWLVEKTRSSSKATDIHCRGHWTLQGIAGLEPRLTTISPPEAETLVIDVSGIVALDTAGAWLLHRTLRSYEQQGVTVQLRGLHTEHDALLQLVVANAAQVGKVEPAAKVSFLAQVGGAAWSGLQDFRNMLAFVGESALVVLRVLVQPRRLRWRAILHNLQNAGVAALPITGLLSFLMGVVIAYQGADQLNRFGANIFIVDLVSLSMLRELSPLLTAIIVAGRSGSAYAAQIGTMKVTEEVDALRTIGIGAQELLVLPKILALVIALPLLTVYADVTGVLGGMLMARAQLDVGFDLFLDRLGDAISLSSFLTGIAKAPVFAAIIALVGCYQGFKVSGSADSVGRHTTISVVQSIFLVIVADALFSIVFNWLKI
jgi:phospholipid/cholesterol/gamma-HCH transport system permease protein